MEHHTEMKGDELQWTGLARLSLRKKALHLPPESTGTHTAVTQCAQELKISYSLYCYRHIVKHFRSSFYTFDFA